MNIMKKLLYFSFFYCICIMQCFATGENTTLLTPDKIAEEVASNKLSMNQKVALLQIAGNYDISFNTKSKAVIKKFLLELMTSYESSKDAKNDDGVKLSKETFIDLFRNLNLRLNKSELYYFFKGSSVFDKCSFMEFEKYLNLFFENGLYTKELYQKLVGVLNSKISLSKKGFLLQMLNNPPYKKQDILNFYAKDNNYDDASSYYSKKSSLYDSFDFEKKYDKIFYNTAFSSDQFLKEAGVIKEICWDGFVLSAEDTISQEKLAKLFVKRLKLIVNSKQDSIIIQYLEALNVDNAGELDLIPKSKIYLLSSLLSSKNKYIIIGVIAILKEKTGKDFNSPEAWKKAIKKMPEEK